MSTLLEYITYVKGIEYLIVIAFCFAFIALWMMTLNSEKENIKGVLKIIALLSIVFGGAAVVIASNGSNEPVVAEIIEEDDTTDTGIITGHDVEKWLEVNNSEYLAISYGPAIKFHKVMIDKVSCQTCHHNSGDEIHACRDCHDRPFNPEDSDKPGLKAAYHQRCMFCHKEVFGGPESCTLCHTGDLPDTATLNAPERPHKLTWDTCTRCHEGGIPGGWEIKIVYHDSCIKCHENNVAGAGKVPEDHTGLNENTCDGCHKPEGG